MADGLHNHNYGSDEVVPRSGPPWRCPVCDYRDQHGKHPFMCCGPHDHRHPPREVIPADTPSTDQETP